MFSCTLVGVDLKKARERFGVSLAELAYGSGLTKSLLAAVERGRFRLSPDKETKIRIALELIREHKRAWREIPKRLARELREKHKAGGFR
ncbi:MAG: helix-turn-helix transcriptional regulator [Acidobacteria bacterium]|nr:helix-turn-helix transcriptional regulator [Acidobacteriota bacterium]